MLSAPQPYPSVSAATPAPDDAQIEKKMPSICVDYLSHNWAQEDVWQSWKAMTKRKNEIANGVRLENASWRTWAKQRGNLKTINPETLNWLKDSDVTWLYGPLHEHADPVPPPKVASTQDRLDLDDSTLRTKSILKHRTIGEMLTTPGRAASPAVEVHMDPEFASSAQSSRSSSPQRGTGAQHTLMSVRSDTNLARQGMKKGVKGSPPASARLLSHPSLERSDTTTTAGSEEKRHISFNSRVDQCIAVDYPEEEDEDDDDDDDEYGYSDGDFVDGDEDEAAGRSHFEDGASSPGSADDEGDVLTMKSSPRSVSGSSRQSSFSSSNDHHHIIAKLAPTRLKTSDAYPAPSPAVVDPTGFTSMHGQGQHNGSASSASASIIAGGSSDPKVSSQPHAAEERSAWDDDGVPGVDYFNAPYLADRSSKSSGGAHTGSVVTAQPTLVSGASGSDAGSSSDAASSSSSTAASSAGAAPQPRSILKRRNSGQDAAAAATVPKDEVAAAAAAQVATAAKTPGSGSPFLAQNVSPNSEVDNKANAEAKSATSGAAATGSSSTSAVTSTYDNDTSDDDDDAAPEEEEPGRGRPSQRLGSSASYERIQEAARKSSTSTSASGSSSRASSAASSSMSPSGSQQRGAPTTIATDGGSYAARRASFSDDDGSSSVASYTSATGSASGPSGGKSSGRKGSSSSLRGSSSSHQHQAGPSSSSSSSGGGGKGLPPANSQRLSVDLDNLPSNDPAVQSRLQSKQGGTAGPTPGVGGPTPLNTPTLALAKRRRAGSSSVDDDADDDENDTGDEESLYYTSGRGSSSASAPLSPVIPRRTTATGALVAPSGADRQAGVRVPLADDFVEEDEGGIVGRAVEIVNTARDLIAAVWPTRGR